MRVDWGEANGVIVVRVFEPVFRNLPLSYTDLWKNKKKQHKKKTKKKNKKKNGPIHIIERLYTILPFIFLYPFIAGS